MTEAAPPTGFRKWWADRRWKAGDRLDRMGRWLLLHAPLAARAYARLLVGRRHPPRLFPGWTFGHEYYIARRWLALRRGALWEAALERNLVVPLTVPWYGGTRVEVTLGNDHSLCLYVAGSFEPNEFAFLDRLLRPGMTFVDIGANEGLFSLFAARRVGAAGRVVAVEPSSRERRQLERNIGRNRLANVTVVSHALGSAAGSARLRIAAKLHGGHNTFGDFVHDGASAVASEDVPVETFDGLARRLALGRVDAVKIDVEGAELKVLDGGREFLKRARPVLLIEANEEALQRQNASTAGMIALLRALGYEIRVFSERTGDVERLAGDGPLSANIVAVPSG
jgi:FkbM family methyltransferase